MSNVTKPAYVQTLAISPDLTLATAFIPRQITAFASLLEAHREVATAFSPNEMRRMGWKRHMRWTREGRRFAPPVRRRHDPDAVPPQMVKVHAWTDSGHSADDLNGDHERSGSAYGPCLSRHLYLDEVQGYALANALAEPAEPVAMTFRWHRATDPMVGFFD